MSLFTKQPVHCPCCGKPHEAELTGKTREAFLWHACCSGECRREMDLRVTRSIMGRYTPPPADKACAFCADGAIRCDCGDLQAREPTA